MAHLAPFVLLLAAAAAAPAAAAAAPAERLSLAECMARGGVELIGSDHPGYDAARRTYNGFSSAWPTGVALPATAAQAAAAVRCARAAGVPVNPRCGGHGNEGESVITGHLTLDLQRLAAVRLSRDKQTVRVGGGATMGQLLAGLWRQSNGTRGFPSGSKFSVGVAGFVLGGGFGSFHRWAGLGADQLIALTGVTAAGGLITANATHHADLLWASRGGGGGKFVVVTEMVLATMDLSGGTTNFEFAVPHDRAIETMVWFQAWALGLPNRFIPRSGIEPDPTSPGRVTYFIAGRFFGGEADAKAALLAAGLEVSSGGLARLSDLTFTYERDILRSFATENELGAALAGGADLLSVMSNRSTFEFEYNWYFKYRSLILDAPLPRDALAIVLDAAQEYPGFHVEVKFLGGAVAAVPPEASAASHLRRGAIIFILRGTKVARAPPAAAAGAAGACLDAAGAAAAAAAAGAEVRAGSHNATRTIKAVAASLGAPVRSYINFRDSDVPSFVPDYRAAYYGDNVAALECLKAKYDPGDLFRQPLDIEPPPGGAPPGCAPLLARLGAATAAYSRQLGARVARGAAAGAGRAGGRR
ncbi:xylO [Scenedesmus sp. PABB004]|nr:xylO [Scenedesmus sp. PABB004]